MFRHRLRVLLTLGRFRRQCHRSVRRRQGQLSYPAPRVRSLNGQALSQLRLDPGRLRAVRRLRRHSPRWLTRRCITRIGLQQLDRPAIHLSQPQNEHQSRVSACCDTDEQRRLLRLAPPGALIQPHSCGRPLVA